MYNSDFAIIFLKMKNIKNKNKQGEPEAKIRPQGNGKRNGI